MDIEQWVTLMALSQHLTRVETIINLIRLTTGNKLTQPHLCRHKPILERTIHL